MKDGFWEILLGILVIIIASFVVYGILRPDKFPIPRLTPNDLKNEKEIKSLEYCSSGQVVYETADSLPNCQCLTYLKYTPRGMVCVEVKG